MIKPELHKLALERLEEKRNYLKTQMSEVQESINGDSKSSVGDKYETSRAMGHLEIERLVEQFKACESDISALRSIDPNKRSQTADAGALITMNRMKLYLTVALGKIEHQGEVYIAVSPVSPIALQLKGKGIGDEIQIAGISEKIIDIQ